jgi:hypothetical protein
MVKRSLCSKYWYLLRWKTLEQNGGCSLLSFALGLHANTRMHFIVDEGCINVYTGAMVTTRSSLWLLLNNIIYHLVFRDKIKVLDMNSIKKIGIFFLGCILPKIKKIQYYNRKISLLKNFPIFLSKNERFFWRKKLLVLDSHNSISTFLGFKVYRCL